MRKKWGTKNQDKNAVLMRELVLKHVGEEASQASVMDGAVQDYIDAVGNSGGKELLRMRIYECITELIKHGSIRRDRSTTPHKLIKVEGGSK